MRTINAKFLALLLIGVAMLVGALFGMHRLQAASITEALLWQADQAEKDGNLQRAAKFLTRYLEFARDDLDQRDHLAMLLSDPQIVQTPPGRARARFVIEQVLAKDPERHELRLRLCEILLANRKFDAVKEHLNYLDKNHPELADVAFLTGVWNEAQTRTQPAVDAYRRAIKLDAAKVDACTRLVGLLKQLDFGKEPRFAGEIDGLIAAALVKAPHDANVLSLAAQHAHEKGNTAVALSYLEDGLKRHPAEHRLYLALSRIHSQAGRRGEAIAQLKAGLQKVRKDRRHELRWSLANLLLDDNQLDEANKVSAEVRESNPLWADYLDARGQMQRGRWFEAARQFERIRPALKATKELAVQIDLYLGACYEHMEEPALQLTAFQRAAEADPTSPVARRGMAGARWALGQTGEAMQIYAQIVASTKDPEEAARRRLEYIRMAVQTNPPRQAKEWRKIDDDLTDIEKVLIKSIDVALLRAEIHFGRAEREKAETLLHTAIKEHADRHEPWMLLIHFAGSKGEHEAAAKLMQSAESRFNDKAEFRLAQVRYWGQFRTSEAVASMQRLEGALGKFTPKERSVILQTLTEAYYFANAYADAARVLRQMIELPLHTQDVHLRMQLLEVVLLQDDDAQAREVLKDIKRLEGDGPTAADWSFGEALRLMRAGRRGGAGDPRRAQALEQARHLLTVTAAQRPNWHAIVQARAELDELQGRIDQALANYRRAFDLGSRDPQVMKQLIHLLSQAHRFDEVDEIIARMQKLYGTTDEVVKGFVHNAYQRHDYQKAEYLARQLVAKNSQNYRDHLWLGQILTAGGKKSAEAEKAFRRAAELGPAQPETWIGLVRYLVGAGQSDGARAEMENARKAPLGNARLLTLAQCGELLGAYGDAAENYKAGVQAQPESVLMHRAAADFFARINRPLEAEPLYRKVAERQLPARDDEVVQARRNLAIALAKSNRPQKVAEALQLVGLTCDANGNIPADKIADSLEEQVVQAKVLAAIHHHKLHGKAIAMLEALMQKNALTAESQFLLARLQAQYDERGLWPKTRALVRALTVNLPKNPRFLAFAAHLHIRHREFKEAEHLIARLEQLEQERKAAPGGFGSIELLAKSMEMRGLGSQAVALLTEYAEQPEAAPARKLLLATLFGRLGDFREAVDLCLLVRQTGASYNEANAAMMAILRHNRPTEAQPTKHEQWLEQRKRVEQDLRSAIERDPTDVPLRLHLADLMELQGKYDDVEKICREVLRDHDTNLVALNNLAWLLALRPGRGNEALSLITRAIDKHGPRPELVDTRAVVLLHLGKLDESIRDLERVVNEAPTPARLFHLSQAYERARNAPSAMASLRRASEMGLSVQHLHPVEHLEYQRVMNDLGKRQ